MHGRRALCERSGRGGDGGGHGRRGLDLPPRPPRDAHDLLTAFVLHHLDVLDHAIRVESFLESIPLVGVRKMSGPAPGSHACHGAKMRSRLTSMARPQTTNKRLWRGSASIMSRETGASPPGWSMLEGVTGRACCTDLSSSSDLTYSGEWRQETWLMWEERCGKGWNSEFHASPHAAQASIA